MHRKGSYSYLEHTLLRCDCVPMGIFQHSVYHNKIWWIWCLEWQELHVLRTSQDFLQNSDKDEILFRWAHAITLPTFPLIEPNRNCQSWHPKHWWNKGVQFERPTAVWNYPLYQFQQSACWCPVVSDHRGRSVVAAIMRILEHEWVIPMTTGISNIVGLPTSQLAIPRVSRYLLCAR